MYIHIIRHESIESAHSCYLRRLGLSSWGANGFYLKYDILKIILDAAYISVSV